MLSHNPWLWASLTDAEMCWGPTTAETSLEDLGIQNKTFGATVPKTSEDGKPTRDDLLSVTWASAEFPNQWLAALPLLSTNFSEMLWQFVWCQRVSVWLWGMCLHLNIWGLIINIRNFFFKQENKHAGRIMDYQRNWILPEKYNSKEKNIWMESWLWFCCFWYLHLYSHY